MSNVFKPETTGMLHPDVRDDARWEGKDTRWPAVNSERVSITQQLNEVSFSGLGGLLFELDHVAVEMDTSTASYYMEARRVAEGFPALVGEKAIDGYRFLVVDNIGVAVIREDKATKQLLDMRDYLLFDRFKIGERTVLFQPEGVGVDFSRIVPTGRVKALRQVAVDKPLLGKRGKKRKRIRDL